MTDESRQSAQQVPEKDILCTDCGWRGPDAVWKKCCKGFPCRLGSQQVPDDVEQRIFRELERQNIRLIRDRNAAPGVYMFGGDFMIDIPALALAAIHQSQQHLGTTREIRVYAVEGGFVIADNGTWLDGVFATEEDAIRSAIPQPDNEVERLREKLRGLSFSLAAGSADDEADLLKLIERVEWGVDHIQQVEARRAADARRSGPKDAPKLQPNEPGGTMSPHQILTDEMIEAGRRTGLPELTRSDYERIYLAMHQARQSAQQVPDDVERYENLIFSVPDDPDPESEWFMQGFAYGRFTPLDSELARHWAVERGFAADECPVVDGPRNLLAAIPQPDNEVELRNALDAVREELRVSMLVQPTTGERRTYNDGFASALSYAIGKIDRINDPARTALATEREG